MNFAAIDREHDGWSTVRRTTHFEDPHLLVATEEVRAPASERIRSWTVVRRKAAVVVAPLTRDGKLVLIRQERIPIRATIWEVPAGQIDDATADTRAIEAVALRELEEEAGYHLCSDGELISLGGFYSSPGFTDERAHFFLAKNVEPAAAGHSHQDSESILDCRAFSASELADMIARDEIRDANTLSICAKLMVRGFLTLRA